MSLTLVAIATLTACGGDGGPSVVTDPGPSEEPTVGSYPAFAPTNYDYTLTTTCFCGFAGVPVRVSVRDGRVAKAVLEKRADGKRAGDPADEWLRVTIQEIIDHANDTEADEVRVRWPAGQDHPSSVFVDADRNASDEEIGYEVTAVDVLE